MNDFQKNWIKVNSERFSELTLCFFASRFFGYSFLGIVLYYYLVTINSEFNLFYVSFDHIIAIAICIVHFSISIFLSLNSIMVIGNTFILADEIENKKVDTYKHMHSYRCTIASTIKYKMGIFNKVLFVSEVIFSFFLYFNFENPNIIFPFILSIFFLIYLIINQLSVGFCNAYISQYVNPISVAIFEKVSYNCEKTRM